MKDKIDRYRVFNTLAKNLHFSKTAEELFLTQSAVSQSIKSLENSLSTQLFIRGKKNIMLTSQGELLYSYTQKAISFIEVAETLIAKENNLELGELKISASDTISSTLLLEHLEYFTTLHPMIKIQVINRTSSQSIQLLKSGQVDLAFASSPIEDTTIELHKICSISDIFVAGEKFYHLKDKILSLQELLSYSIICLENTSNSRKFLEHFFSQYGLAFDPDIQLGSHDLLLEFAIKNMGISCVTKEYIKNTLHKHKIFQVQTQPSLPKRCIYACRLKNFHHTSACKLFLKQMMDKSLFLP